MALFKLAVQKEVGNARLLATIPLYSYSNCRTTKYIFSLIANEAKSTNDLLYFMNRFHSVVCLILILMLEQELKESRYFNTS